MNETPFHTGKILLLNKPLTWTSFDLINKVRFAIERRYKLKRLGIKVGHAGTLDPLATGLMIICTGKMTKQIDSFQGLPKEYIGTFILGATTPCFDLEKEVDHAYPTEHITDDLIYKAALSFIGKQEQAPPAFSAKKVDGKRAYEMARKGEVVTLKTSTIEITAFDITRIEMPEVDFKINCSKGTYVRSLARDFGLALHSGAYLSKLSRTKIGEHTLEQSSTIDEFIKSMQVSEPAADL